METRYVTLNARHRAVARAGEQASGGGVLYEKRVEYRAGVPNAPIDGGKVLDLEEYRRRLAQRAPAEEPLELEEVPSPAPRRASWGERFTLVLDVVVTVALFAVAAGGLLAVWSWM